MYKLVVSDMDGTLLTSHNTVSEKNKQALKALQDQNIQVAIATGRIYTSAKVYAKYLGIITPIIACNGAIIKDLYKDEILYESGIKKEDCLKVLEICRAYDLYFHFYTANTFYAEKLERASLNYSEWNKTLKEEDRIDLQIIKDAAEVIKSLDENIYKIQMISDDEALRVQVREEINKIHSIECSKSWHNNIEIMNKGVSKAEAVKHLGKIFDVKREEIICFGDNENDISMLSYAGLGIAMGNANEIVKKNADYVTTTNDEDGVARALHKFVF